MIIDAEELLEWISSIENYARGRTVDIDSDDLKEWIYAHQVERDKLTLDDCIEALKNMKVREGLCG